MAKRDTDSFAYHFGLVIPPKRVDGLPVVVHTNAELLFLDENFDQVMVRVAIQSDFKNDRYFSAN